MPKIAPELLLLALAVVIGLVNLVWASVAAGRGRDPKWLVGPRDEPMSITGLAGRVDRAFRNFMETFPFFAAAVITAYLAGKLGTLTLWGSGLYVAARAIYPPLYVAGVPYIRSLVWLVGLVGLIMVLTAVFL